MIAFMAVILAVSAQAGLCEKACIAPHDAKVVACKTVQTEDKDCVARAAAERKACEKACKKKKRKK